MSDVKAISATVRRLREARAAKDRVMGDIYRIRDGRIGEVFPSMFNDDFPAPVMANGIDTFARDVAESLAPLPTFAAGTQQMTSDAARKRADMKTRIVYSYLAASQVAARHVDACDHWASYGLKVTVVEPDFTEKLPRISFVDPRGVYYEKDHWGRMRHYARVFTRTRAELCSLYPHLEPRLTDPQHGKTRNSEDRLEVVHWIDSSRVLMFVPDCQDLVLHEAKNRLGEVPVSVAERPGVTEDPRGQYDDVMWIQVARNRFTMLAMEAAEQAVEAPLALPNDVAEVAIGPHAGLRSNTPEKIRKVGQEIPQAAFAEGSLLDAEMKAGARYPGVRTGNLDASIITGQGVRALEGGFDSQIRSAHDIFEPDWINIIRLCLKTDETYWPDVEKETDGRKDGVPYKLNYTPGKDIKGDYTVDVRYGMVAGLDANRALVFLLQVLGGGLLSKDTIRRELPFSLDISQEEGRIEAENMRDAMVQAMAGLAQSIPMMAQMGQDPMVPIRQLADVIKSRQKGKPIEDAVLEAFTPPEPEEAPAEAGAGPGAEDPLSALLGGAGGGGMGGLPEGVAPGQAQMGPGGMPDIMTMLAGLNSGGGPTTNVNVKRSIPA
ncbi:hypothetical protein [Actinocorallia libanotica]|uniref:hypothetical protein n=2 Tax=Actinocorallia TaxID=58108 RepID=UPI0031D4367B